MSPTDLRADYSGAPATLITTALAEVNEWLATSGTPAPPVAAADGR